MHRRTSVLNPSLENSSPEFSPARLPPPAMGKRPHSFAWATTPARTGRYRLELSRGAVPFVRVDPNDKAGCIGSIRQMIGSPRNRKNQSDLCEHQAVQFRSHKRGIAPDVVRREMESPEPAFVAASTQTVVGCTEKVAAARLFGSEIARVCFLQHFTLAQPYF